MDHPTDSEESTHPKRPLISTEEALLYLGKGMGQDRPVSEDTLRSLVTRKIIHRYRRQIGRGFLYDPDELDAAVKPEVVSPDEP